MGATRPERLASSSGEQAPYLHGASRAIGIPASLVGSGPRAQHSPFSPAVLVLVQLDLYSYVLWTVLNRETQCLELMQGISSELALEATALCLTELDLGRLMKYCTGSGDENDDGRIIMASAPLSRQTAASAPPLYRQHLWQGLVGQPPFDPSEHIVSSILEEPRKCFRS